MSSIAHVVFVVGDLAQRPELVIDGWTIVVTRAGHGYRTASSSALGTVPQRI